MRQWERNGEDLSRVLLVHSGPWAGDEQEGVRACGRGCLQVSLLRAEHFQRHLEEGSDPGADSYALLLATLPQPLVPLTLGQTLPPRRCHHFTGVVEWGSLTDSISFP